MVKRTRKKKAGKTKNTLPRVIGPFALLLLLLFTLAATIYFIFLSPGTRYPYSSHLQQSTDTDKNQPQATPAAGTVNVQLKTPESVKHAKHNKSLVAIIIDDMGYNKTVGDKLLNLDLELSYSFLPHGPNTPYLLKEARDKSRDILLHLPMEALDEKRLPGPGAVFLDMDYGTMAEVLQKDLKEVPMAVGINNHMGSRFTQNSGAMRQLLTLVKQHDLFFMDSVTTPESVAYTLSKELRVKTVKRDFFLDNIQNMTDIIAQLDKLLLKAKKDGRAIGIAHPKQKTFEALSLFQDRLRHEIKLVGIHHLVE